MKGIMVRWLILTGAILIASYLIGGIRVGGFFSALFAAAVLGILNVFLRPILLILTLPLNILTLGFFTFVINALLLMMASGVISGFQVSGFWSALFGSFIISIVNWITSSFVNEQGHVSRGRAVIDLERKDNGKWG